MNGEKGQAMVIALIALALGTLVVTPFLSHAGTNLIGSRTQGAIINEHSAGDAGVEDAIWNLAYGGLASAFTHSGDQVTYQLDGTVNGFNPVVTITANVTSQNSTAGTISDSVIDSLQYESGNSYLPTFIMVSSDVCAVAYRGPSNRGYVKTASIDADGNIGNSTIDSLTFDTSTCYEPKIINVSGSIYAAAYRGASNRGYLKTFSIDAAGNIGASTIDSLTFDTASCYEPDIINVSGSTFAVAYRGQSSRGYVRSVSIDAAGNIGNSYIDTLTFDSSACYTPRIEQVSSSIYGIAYRGAGNDGYLRTVSIDAGGNISNSYIDSLTFDTSNCYTPDFVPVSGSIFSIAYRGTSNRGYLRTVSIDSAGNIGAAYISTYTFDLTGTYEPSLLQTSSGVFAIAYRDGANRGKIVTAAIAADGTITASLIDTLIFDSTAGYESVVVQVNSAIFAIAYRGSSNRGYVCTIGIVATSTSTAALWQIISTAGGTTIKAYVNTVNTTATVVSWQIY